MKTLLDVIRTAQQHRRSVMYTTVAILLAKRKFKSALGLVLIDLYSRGRNSATSELINIGAETKLYNKYLGVNVVTFRDDETLTALDLQSLAQDSARTSHRHVVFLAADGHAALWAPVMAKLISMRGRQNVVVHACTLSDTAIPNLSKWIRQDLISQDTDRVTLVAHASDSTAAVAAFIRASPELANVVTCVFVNPHANSKLLFPRYLPLKRIFVNTFANLLSRFIAFSRVLHDRLVPFVDPTILEFALLNAKHSAGPSQIDTSTPLPVSLAIVCGDQDWSSGRSEYEELNRLLGGIKSVVFLRGLGSFPHLEDPEKMAETIREFIDSKSAH